MRNRPRRVQYSKLAGLRRGLSSRFKSAVTYLSVIDQPCSLITCRTVTEQGLARSLSNGKNEYSVIKSKIN